MALDTEVDNEAQDSKSDERRFKEQINCAYAFLVGAYVLRPYSQTPSEALREQMKRIKTA